MTKKRIAALILAVVIILAGGAARASDPITISVTPLDYHTGRAISKPAYNADQLFKLRVCITVPRFMDTSNFELRWLTDGVDIMEISQENDCYILTGIVLERDAALTVQMKDCAFENADTAEEMFYAMQEDRTVQCTYYFLGEIPKYQDTEVLLPKTGSMSILPIPILMLLAAALTYRAKKYRR